MKLVVGLGNPGKKYEHNRHNAGLIILDAFVQLRGLSWSKQRKIMAQIAVSKEDGAILVKPETFMNVSGRVVAQALSYYSIPVADLIVVHDDVDLEPKQLRVAVGASAAGHHGVQHIIEQIGSQGFTRIRVGIGRPAENSRQVEHYVLTDFSAPELEVVKKIGIEQLLSSLKA